ncbi:MAG: hypothetical protein HZA93_15780 [Verrucomicrobia bacterium]|nr:hypothetical protein [Verrucomicrobiota bacterium]
MISSPTDRLARRWPRLVPWVLIAAAALPVGWMALRVAATLRNVAYWDEIDSALQLLLRLHDQPGWRQVLNDLFAITNEHRTVTSRLLFAGSYWLTGTVNFTAIGLMGNAFICGLCALVVFEAGAAARRIRMLVLLAGLLFQLQHYENFQWSGGSIDHFQIVLLAGACVAGLTRGSRTGFLAASLFALLATFTLAHGIVLWPLGALLLGLEQRWRRLAGWAVVAAASLAFFLSGFGANPGHQIALHAGALGHMLRYWLEILGAPLALGAGAAGPFLGIALLVLFGRLLVKGAWRREKPAVALALWAIGSAALIAVGRAELAHGLVYSRYYVLSGLAWALVLFIQFEEWTDPARPHLVTLRALPLLALFNIVANIRAAHDARSWVICRDNAAEYYGHYGRDGVGRFSLYPDPARATKIIREVEQAGLYRMPEPCRPRQFPRATPAASFSYFVDRITVDDALVAIEGWAAVPGRAATAGKIHVILQSPRSRLIFTTLPMPRPDVAAVHTGERWLDAGFRFQRRRWLLPKENFQVGLLIESESGAEFMMTAHRLDMTGKGVGLIAGE